ncbi:MAG: autotransporter domain-containing protein, partial [Hyphomicrobiales bacterium]
MSPSVVFEVTFDEAVSGLSNDDFVPVTTAGDATGVIASVSPITGTVIIVTVNAIVGTGSLSLGLRADSDIIDVAGNGNGTNGYATIFTEGEDHDVDTEGSSVTISGAPPSISGVTPFELTYTFLEDVTDFDDVADIIVAGGISSAPTGSGKVYTSTITPSGAGDVTVQVPEGAAMDTAGNPNKASAAEVITNTIVEDTQKVIASFMLNRASQILANQPDLIGFLEGTNSDGGGPLGYLGINGNDAGMDLSFSSSLSKVDRARAESLQQLATRRVSNAHNALTFAAETPNVANGGDLAGNGYMPTRKYDIWTQIYGSTTHAGDSDSSFWIGYLGAHYFVTPDMIIGGLVQVDWADEENGTSASSADGKGWMIGPYIAGRITGTGLNYEARASWGRSSNNVSPLGTYTDEFETERWLASFKLKGDYMLDMVTFRPSVSVSYFEEEQESYTDGLSNIIPSQTVSLGEVKFGPEFIRDIALSDGSLFRPSIGISGVWNFGIEEGASPQGYALGNDDLRARLDVGFSLSNPHG